MHRDGDGFSPDLQVTPAGETLLGPEKPGQSLEPSPLGVLEHVRRHENAGSPPFLSPENLFARQAVLGGDDSLEGTLRILLAGLVTHHQDDLVLDVETVIVVISQLGRHDAVAGEDHRAAGGALGRQGGRAEFGEQLGLPGGSFVRQPYLQGVALAQLHPDQPEVLEVGIPVSGRFQTQQLETVGEVPRRDPAERRSGAAPLEFLRGQKRDRRPQIGFTDAGNASLAEIVGEAGDAKGKWPAGTRLPEAPDWRTRTRVTFEPAWRGSRPVRSGRPDGLE